MLINLENLKLLLMRAHQLAAVTDVQTFVLSDKDSHNPLFAPFLHRTHTHTHRRLLSICDLHREAMKVCNDATWQPIKLERDEDAIRLSSTLELLPTKQMEGAKRRGGLFLEGDESFQGERAMSAQTLDIASNDWEMTIIECDRLCHRASVCSSRLDPTVGFKGRTADEVYIWEK